MRYVDTSVLALAALDQAGAGQAHSLLEHTPAGSRLVSSDLLRIEWARLKVRMGTTNPYGDNLIDKISCAPIDQDVIARACQLTEDLKSLDAIHLATALELAGAGVPVTMLTHDARLAQVAAAHGLEVIDPTV